MIRVLSATTIAAAAMLAASGASAAPPAPLTSGVAQNSSQIEKVHERRRYRVRRYYNYAYDGPVYYRRPAYRYYGYDGPYAYGPRYGYTAIDVPFFSLRIGPHRRYHHRYYRPYW